MLELLKKKKRGGEPIRFVTYLITPQLLLMYESYHLKAFLEESCRPHRNDSPSLLASKEEVPSEPGSGHKRALRGRVVLARGGTHPHTECLLSEEASRLVFCCY